MKKAIVIGATSGMGRGLAQLLVRNNYKVGITGRRLSHLEDLKRQDKEFYVFKSFDICDLEIVVENLEELIYEIGGLDLLILCAGAGNENKALDFEMEQQIIATNILGFTKIVDWAFNYFENQLFGHLVAISSFAGLRGNKYAPASNATKAYQINYLEALRQKATNSYSSVVVTDIRPGFVDTDMAKGENLFWVASVNEDVKQIFLAIKSKKKVAYITKRWNLLAFILKRIPRAFYDKM